MIGSMNQEKMDKTQTRDEIINTRDEKRHHQNKKNH